MSSSSVAGCEPDKLWRKMWRLLPKLPDRASNIVNHVKPVLDKLLFWHRRMGSAANRQADFQRGVIAYEKCQYMTALVIWKEGALGGDGEAAYRIAQLYAHGEGVIRSIPDAVKWYERAAEAGHGEAQFQLGSIYACGATVAVNGAENWFKSASRRDGKAAQRNVGVLFSNGLTIEQDLET